MSRSGVPTRTRSSHRVSGRLDRLYGRFALIDEAYALTTTPTAQQSSSPRILTMQVLMHAYWWGGGSVGSALGAAVPTSMRGVDFTFSPAGCQAG